MHVVVLGAGYAGLTLTKRLEENLPQDASLTLVNDSPDHLVQHELHRAIRRPELAAELTVSLTDAVERATVRVARVEEIDRKSRLIACSNGTLSYDIAAICLGAETAYYGLEGVREHATPLKRLDHAMQIRREFFAALENDDPRVVVGGAGLSGVQVAGELAALAEEESTDVTLSVLEQYDRIAPNFPSNFQRAIRDGLEEYGVEVRTQTTVTGADGDAISVDSGERLEYDQFVWAGGIRGTDVLDGSRPTVNSDLRLDDRTFAVGDAAAVLDVDGEPVPASAQSAVREAKTVAESISRIVDAEADGTTLFEPRLASFSFESPGWLVTIGDDVVAQIGPTVFTGRAAKALKTTVGVGYLSSVSGVRNAFDRAGVELRLAYLE